MRILIAPDKFKSSLSALAAAEHIARALRQKYPAAELDLCPLSDGGEGFLDTLLAATNGTRHVAHVTGPLPDQTVDAAWGFLGGEDKTIAVIEMATASGLMLVPSELRDPLNTTTFGTGQLLLAALHAGATEIVLGLGGSATVDAGLGLCQAAQHTILRHDGETISPTDPLCARDIADIYMIKTGRGSPLDRIPITVACDVTAPLTGPMGAARVFGPQKGASAKTCDFLDAQIAALAVRCHKEEQAQMPGAGAAGGLAWALLSFFNATLTPGFDLVAKYTDLRDRIARADVVVTAEGCFDESSLQNKTPVAIARLCHLLNKPCHVFAGRVTTNVSEDLFASITAITPPSVALGVAIARAGEFLEDAVTCSSI